MANSSIEKFMAAAIQDPELTAQLNAGQAVADEAGAEAFVRSIVAAAEKLGICFTGAEFLQWLQAQTAQSPSEELSDDELESVAGGVVVVGASYIMKYFRVSPVSLPPILVKSPGSNSKL